MQSYDCPPSYEACLFENTVNIELDEKKEGEVTNMNSDFAPQYPYYRDFNI